MVIDKHSCQSIQCGATTQLEAGMQEIMDCASAGYVGVRSCIDPICVGDLMPAICKPQPTNYSPPNNANHPANETSAPPTDVTSMIDRTVRGSESKRKRSYYQDMVECPGGETTPFMIGLDRWKSWPNMDNVYDTLPVIGDLGAGELAGFLLPAVAIGLATLYLSGRLLKK